MKKINLKSFLLKLEQSKTNKNNNQFEIQMEKILTPKIN